MEQRFAGAAVRLRVRRREVDPAEPVHLQIDEAGDGDPLARALAQGDIAHRAVQDRDVARDENALDDSGFHTEPHRTSTLCRTLPPAVFSRMRASSAPTPRRSETMATFASPRASASAASTS